MGKMAEYEKRARRENAIFGTVLLVAIVVMSILLGMAGLSVHCGMIPPL